MLTRPLAPKFDSAPIATARSARASAARSCARARVRRAPERSETEMRWRRAMAEGSRSCCYMRAARARASSRASDVHRT